MQKAIKLLFRSVSDPISLLNRLHVVFATKIALIFENVEIAEVRWPCELLDAF